MSSKTMSWKCINPECPFQYETNSKEPLLKECPNCKSELKKIN